MMARRLWGDLSAASPDLPRGHRPLLIAILTAAFVLRLGIAWFVPSIQHADEIYQVAEQANRAVNGYGVVSWEFQTGSRVAILPTLLKPLYHLHLSARANQMIAAAAFAAMSLLPVWVAFGWAGRLYGLRGAAIAALMTATWFELVYFGPKPTADAVCGYFFIASLFLARPGAPARSIFLGGAGLMFALGLRIQIAPAIGVALLLMAAANGRRLAPLVAGAAAGLTAVGVLEWSWWGVPFGGQIGYLEAEFVRHVSRNFGYQPVTFFLKNYILFYGGALPVVLVLAARGARTAPVLALCAAALLIPFHFIGHKEYRFVLPALPPILTLMGIAAAGYMRTLDGRRWTRTAAVAAAAWLLAMASMGWSDSYRAFWTMDTNRVLAFREIGKDPAACGIALVNMRWYHTPGYSGIGRDIPIYEIREDKDRERLLGAANFVVAGTKAPPPPAPFVPWREYTRPAELAYRRDGPCVPAPDMKIERPPVLGAQ
jgi:phosphatidylinositol glycan class B